MMNTAYIGHYRYTTMKTTLNYIAKKRITKWIARDTALEYWTELIGSGWIRDGVRLIKDKHCFCFVGHGSKTAISYIRLNDLQAKVAVHNAVEVPA